MKLLVEKNYFHYIINSGGISLRLGLVNGKLKIWSATTTLQNPHMAHMAQVTAAAASMKRDMVPDTPGGCGGGGADHSSDDDGSSTMDVKPPIGSHGSVQGDRGRGKGPQGGGATSSDGGSKKTKGRVKIKMEFIDNKLRRYTTFSKRKTGIMKKVSGWVGTTITTSVPQWSNVGTNRSVAQHGRLW